ncbi:response regulator transcription factor [Isoptericola croceus]|uniref:response regulator transcription factor n=1 Tax=Isoptericola croceus TaxID=3031406 RepID=UPI0023F6E6B0|nr:response regulator transcription factor [Isoptericola croceus]
MNPFELLLVEDDADVRDTTRLILERHGFAVRTAADGTEGYALASACPPALAVVDVSMPGMDGLTLTRRLREELSTPVVLLTARDLNVDVVAGLEAGADDYVVKPFDGAVLVARIRAVLRRAHPGSAEPVRLGDLLIDRDAMTIHRGEEEVQVSATEFRLLMLLLDHRPAVLSRTQILRHVWGDSSWGTGRVVDVNIQRLRAKLGTPAIVTVRGAGYKVVDR